MLQKIFSLFPILICIQFNLFAQGSGAGLAPLSGNIYVGAGQTYTTITSIGGLFEAINTNGLSGSTTAFITSNITETGTVSLNQWTETGIGGYTLTIVPYDGIEKIISGNVAGPLIMFNGADRIIIDGNGGLDNRTGTKYLRFRNTNGSNPAFALINDARNNLITNCYIESNNTSISPGSAGTIYFGSTSGLNGNDSNTFSECDIRDRSDASGRPVYAIYSSGTITNSNTFNSNNKIDNCSIYNFFQDDGSVYSAVYLDAGSTDWEITNNSFYQTSSVTQNTASTIACIYNNVNTANNLRVTGNYIGGSSPLCGGTAMTYTGTGSYAFAGIYLNTGSSSASYIDGNTVQNISLTSNSTNSGSTIFRGIYVIPSTGLCHVGFTTGNIIGAASGNGSITINTPLAGSNSFTTIGIAHEGIGNILNNTIGSITLSGASTTGSSTFLGIYHPAVTPSSSVSVTIENNLIGSLTTTSSIQQTNTSRPGSHRGISAVMNTPGTLNITGNFIANLSDLNTAIFTASSVYGIQNSGGSGIYNITGNTIRDLKEGSGSSGSILMCGISCTGTAAKTISQNNIYSLVLNQPGAGGSNITGILAGGSPGGGNITRNKLYNFVNSNSGTSQSIYGIFTQSSSASYTISNNMVVISNETAADNYGFDEKLSGSPNFTGNNIISLQSAGREILIASVNNSALKQPENILTEGSYDKFLSNNTGTEKLAANGVLIYGLLNSASGSVNNYYNTVYISGSQPGGVAFPSYSLYRTSGTMTLRNNLLINARTGGSGNHVVLGNLSGSPSAGWNSSASNYNTLIGSNANTIGEWGSGVTRSIDTWRTSSGGDKQSWCTTTGTFSVSNLFTNSSAGDLTINNTNSEAWIVSGKGVPVTGENIDQGGDSRFIAVSSGVTDIGADEFSSPAVSPPAASFDNAPGPGIVSAYSLWSRTLAAVTWGTGGSEYPSSLNVLYYSGVDPQNTQGGGYSNSYWSITPTGSISGTSYNILLYFGDNETYSISTPGTNTILAKYNTYWDVYPPGTGSGQSQLSWDAGTSAYSVLVNSLSSFSDFALTDASNPLPVDLIEFSASVNARNVILKWATENEINNSGFSVERRTLNDDNSYTVWKSIGFINGRGNSGGKTNYEFTDQKLNSGSYEYRLKQVDFNSNYEYFNLNNPSVVKVENPANYSLSQSYPNPSNPKSKIDYQLPYEGRVSITVYDILGKEISILVNDIKKEGYHTAEFDGTNLASGIYYYKIIITGSKERFAASKKMVLVK